MKSLNAILAKNVKKWISKKKKRKRKYSRIPYLQRVPVRRGNKYYRQLAIYFKGPACPYSRIGECLMCGFYLGTTGFEQPEEEFFRKQWEYVKSYLTKQKDITLLAFYNSGSILDPRQFPLFVLEDILCDIAQMHQIERVLFESRPEFLTEERLQLFRHILPHKIIEFGVGLESANDFVRVKCLQKGITRTEFERCVKLCHSFDMKVLAYCLLRPPLLTEREAIDDTLDTIEYAVQTGVETVAIEPLFIYLDSALGPLLARGLCHPPWLWSVKEVLRQTSYQKHITLGYPDDDPQPDIIAQNCTRCTPLFYRAFKKYNETGDISVFNISCECSKLWQEELKIREPYSLKHRLEMAQYILQEEDIEI